MGGPSREAVGSVWALVVASVAALLLGCLVLLGVGHWPALLAGALAALGLSRALLHHAQQPLSTLSRRLSAVAAAPTGASPVPDSGPTSPLEEAVADLHRRVTGSLEVTRQGREAAQDAGVYKTAFLKAVSHELRTPLNAILGFTQVLLSGLEGDLSAERRENLEVIRDAGQRLLEIFNDSIELSTMASGQLSLRRERVGVAALLNEVVGALEQQRGDRPVHIHTSVPDAPLRLSVQPDRLLTALRTLGDYALERTDSGAVRFVAALAGAPDHLVPTITLSIEDGGPAVSAAELSRLFHPELATDVNDRRRSLRLAITKQLIELHGGRLELIEGVRGQTFAVHLPAALHQRSETPGPTTGVGDAG